MSTTEQRRTEAMQRREKLEARTPQLIEIVKKGQHFTLYTASPQPHTEDIYLWCEMGPSRLYWEPSVPSGQPKVKNPHNCLPLDLVQDIIVSQSNSTFAAHNMSGNQLLCCVELSIDQNNDSDVSPKQQLSPDGAQFSPRSLSLKAKDRLQLEVLVIAVRKLLESAGFDLQVQAPSPPTPAPSVAQPQHVQAPSSTFVPPPKNSLLETLTPKQVVKLLIKNHPSLTSIDLLPFLDLLYYHGIPITRVYLDVSNLDQSGPNSGQEAVHYQQNPSPSPQTPLKIEETRLFFYPDVSKGVLYWGSYRKPSGMLKLYEISELLCGKTTTILKDPLLDQYDASKSITVTALTPENGSDGTVGGRFTSLIISNGDQYDLSLLMFAVHRLVCDPESTDKMREKYRKKGPDGDTKSAPEAVAPVTQTTAMLVKKNNNDPNDITIKPPSLTVQPVDGSSTHTHTQTRSLTTTDSDRTESMPPIIKVDFGDHMSWLLEQFRTAQAEESSANSSTMSKNGQSSGQSTKNSSIPVQTDEIDAFVSRITRKAKVQRSQVTIEIPELTTTNNAQAAVLPTGPMSPIKQRLDSYTSSSSQLLSQAVAIREGAVVEKTDFEAQVAQQELEILQLEMELAQKRSQIQLEKDKIKAKRQADAERAKTQREEMKRRHEEFKTQNDSSGLDLTLNFSNLSLDPSSPVPATPTKAGIELNSLKQSLSKAKSQLTGLNRKLLESQSQSQSQSQSEQCKKESSSMHDDEHLDFDLAVLSFSLDDVHDGSDRGQAQTTNQQQRPTRRSFGSQLELDLTTRQSLEEFKLCTNSAIDSPGINDSDNNNNNNFTRDINPNPSSPALGEILIDVSSLLLDTTKDVPVLPSAQVDQQLDAIPSLPKSPNMSFGQNSNSSSVPSSSALSTRPRMTRSMTAQQSNQSQSTTPVPPLGEKNTTAVRTTRTTTTATTTATTTTVPTRLSSRTSSTSTATPTPTLTPTPTPTPPVSTQRTTATRSSAPTAAASTRPAAATVPVATAPSTTRVPTATRTFATTTAVGSSATSRPAATGVSSGATAARSATVTGTAAKPSAATATGSTVRTVPGAAPRPGVATKPIPGAATRTIPGAAPKK